MAIPDFQTLMLPLLTLAEDGQDHSYSETFEALANSFQLTEAERRELLASGSRRFDNRIRWAKVHLGLALLLESPERGKFRITERGLQFLKGKPSAINCKLLMQFEEYKRTYSSRRGKRKDSGPEESDQAVGLRTPEETVEAACTQLTTSLAKDLLERVKSMSPEFFEQLVVELLVKMGYGGSLRDAGEAVGGVGDGGIDGVIKEDKLGLGLIYIQAKRWENNVGRPIVQAFAGSLDGVKARRGILITTSSFSKEAFEYAKDIEKTIILIDGDQLAELMIDNNVGVSTDAVYEIKRINADFFEND